MTQHYIGVKIIEAWEQEQGGRAGYAVKYPDGYTSWSPKEVFEEAYIPLGHLGSMPPHQQRVVGEQGLIETWRSKLQKFLFGEIFSTLPAEEQDRLVRQESAMQQYVGILKERIGAF